jgi:hypothetical protein
MVICLRPAGFQRAKAGVLDEKISGAEQGGSAWVGFQAKITLNQSLGQGEAHRNPL